MNKLFLIWGGFLFTFNDKNIIIFSLNLTVLKIKNNENKIFFILCFNMIFHFKK